MNTVVSYLLISFLYHRFHGFHVFSGVIINIIIFSMFLLERMRKEELKWSKSWFVLALCRFSLGICIYSFLSSLIFKSYYYVTRTEYVSNTSKIWKVFGILSLVTIVEVILGILKPESLHFIFWDEFA
jgi:hypothetical protein